MGTYFELEMKEQDSLYKGSIVFAIKKPNYDNKIFVRW